MTGTILVALDGSVTSEVALPLAAEIGRATGSGLLLVTALPPLNVWDAAASAIKWDAEEAAAGKYLDLKRDELVTKGLDVRTHVGFGIAADVILNLAETEKVTLIAMATHGRSGVGRWVMGSVTDKVLHGATTPLLVVRPPMSGTRPPLAASIKKVLVPLDGSALSCEALPAAESMAKALGASLYLCTVVSNQWIGYPGIEGPVVYQDVLKDMESAAHNSLEQAASEVRSRGVAVDYVVATGLAVDEILRIAKDEGAGLIVISTHGRSGLGRWVIGSVADAVVRRAETPCLLVRPNGGDKPPQVSERQAAQSAKRNR